MSKNYQQIDFINKPALVPTMQWGSVNSSDYPEYYA